jgi:hypothetical protein
VFHENTHLSGDPWVEETTQRIPAKPTASGKTHDSLHVRERERSSLKENMKPCWESNTAEGSSLSVSVTRTPYSHCGLLGCDVMTDTDASEEHNTSRFSLSYVEWGIDLYEAGKLEGKWSVGAMWEEEEISRYPLTRLYGIINEKITIRSITAMRTSMC